MGRSKAKTTQRNRQAKVRKRAARRSMVNTPTQLPKAVIPGKAHLDALRSAYKEFHLADKALDRQQDRVRRELAEADTLQPIEEHYHDKTNLMIVACLQQSLVRHRPTGRQYNFFGNTVAAIKEHAEAQLWGTPFRHDPNIRLKPPPRVQHARQAASAPAPSAMSASARGAAMLRQFNVPRHQFQCTWFSNRGG